jgi:hypothetical protein
MALNTSRARRVKASAIHQEGNTTMLTDTVSEVYSMLGHQKPFRTISAPPSIRASEEGLR